MSNVINLPSKQRMQKERFQAEDAFQTRYLEANEKTFDFFGCTNDDFQRFKREGWPSYKEREKPDYRVNEDGKVSLYECIGSGGKDVKIRYTKPMSMAHWCAKLDADGFYAIYDSTNDVGYLVPSQKMDELLNHADVTICQYDNKLWVVPMHLVIWACGTQQQSRAAA